MKPWVAVFALLSATAATAGYISLPESGGGGGSGDAIEELTGDVLATGPGSASATVSSVGGSAAADVHTAELLANQATNANTVSRIVKRDGSGNFSAGTITAALTGAASSNVLKAGDTMTGPLNMPAGSASTAELTGGTANTGLFFPSSSTAAFTSGGTEVWRTGASGITIGNTTAQTCSLYLKPGASTIGIQIENTNNTRKYNVIDGTSANLFCSGMNGTNYQMCLSNVATGGTGVGWTSFGANGTANPPAWPMAFETISGDGNVTAITTFTALKGATVNGLPIIVQRNRNSTVDTLAEWGNTGSSGNLMGGWGTRHKVQTASSEEAEWYVFKTNAGTQQEQFRIKVKGLFEAGGTIPTVTCNSNSATVETGSSATYARFTAPSSPGTTCVVTIPDTADSKPICQASNETDTTVVPMICSSTTSCTITDAGLTASDVLSFHCGAHI